MPRPKPEGYALARHRGGFVVLWYDESGRRHRHSLGTTDRAQAQATLGHFVASREQRQRPARVTVGAIMDAYISDRIGKVRSPSAIESAWRAMKPHFRDLLPEHITQAVCETYQRARMRQKVRSPNPKAAVRYIRPATVRQELGVLRAALNWSAKKDWITKAPYIWRPGQQKPRERHLTREEFDKLLTAAAMPHVRLYMLLAIHTAGRMQAILDLTWDRVDLERRILTLATPDQDARSKGRATVKINKTLFAALTDARKGGVTDYVIEWGGAQVGTVKKAFREACIRAGIKGCTPHTLRHTATVWMVTAGIPMEKVAKFLGHASPDTTRRHYAHFAPDYLDDAAAALE